MNFHLLKQWIKYFHLATDEHSLHSPFFYQLYIQVFRSQELPSSFHEIEKLRENFKNSSYSFSKTELGAGSKVHQSKKIMVSQVAKTSLSSPRFMAMLSRLINYFQFKQVVELGTSLGISTAYLASSTDVTVSTFEGDPKLVKLASTHLKLLPNVQLIEGNIDQELEGFLKGRIDKIDLVYFDANHTYDATLRYFEICLAHAHEKSVFIFDDIHWSKEMTQAWKTLKRHPKVMASIDIFDAGLVFFEPSLNREHLILQF